ncbi:hypothetical protein [Phycisphaera mikurensis]|uniref:hypothetical protein n=1 Tax=Phycisphaera mikurensis TaxID=547188 RepID=UPI00059D7FE2|nr:hypothetical protein [Phycisphaera mikurensis]MBB6442470.1 hypothetical protein [Phycisphaera mikurensis]
MPLLRGLPGRCGPIRLEVDGRTIRAAQQAADGTPIDAVEVPRPERPPDAADAAWPGPAESEALARVLARRRFRGRRVVLSVPQEACFSTCIEGGTRAAGASEAAAAAEAVRRGAAAVGAAEDDFLGVATAMGNGRGFLVRGCRRTPLELGCAALAGAGLRVVGVRSRADALARAAALGSAAGGGEVLVLLDRWESPGEAGFGGQLVVACGGRCVYLRGLHAIPPAEGREASPAECEALAAELSPGLRHAQRLLGAESDPALCTRDAGGRWASALADRLGLRLLAIGGAAGVSAVAAGLGGGADDAVDLLPPAIRRRRREARARGGLLGSAAGYAAAVAVIAALLASSGPDEADGARVDASTLAAEADAEAVAAHAAGLELEAVRGRLEALAAEAVASERAADRPDWRLLLDRLAADARGRVRFTELSIAPAAAGGAARIRVAGEADDPAAAWAFALALEAGELFERVELARARRVGAETPGVRFEVLLELMPLPAGPDGDPAG